MRFDMLGIYTNDLSKMVEFYRDVVGLETSWESSDDFAEFENDGIRFCIFQKMELVDLLDDLTPQYPPGTPNGTFLVSFNFPLVEDVRREYTRMIDSGAHPVYGCREMSWGAYSAMITDPEGNLIELTTWNDSEPGTSNGSH